MTEEVNDLVQENMEFERKKQEYMKKFKMKLKQKCQELGWFKTKVSNLSFQKCKQKHQENRWKCKITSQKNEGNNETHINRMKLIVRENYELEKELNWMKR